jgi:cytochrome P450
MSFGGGAHFCLGAALARLEAVEALPMLHEAFDVHPVGTPVPRPGLALHGYARLPVHLTRLPG